jgi:hypothetical protein
LSSSSFEASNCQSLASFRGRGNASVANSKLHDPLWLPAMLPVRPTGHRLLLAIGLASVLLATVLQLDLHLGTGMRERPTADEAPLDVYITSRKTERLPEMVTAQQTISAPEVNEQLQTGLAPAKVSAKQDQADPADPPVDSQPTRDWHALVEHSVRATVDEYISQEDVRASMWQQTRSVMFRPRRNSSAVEEEPLLTDIRFRKPVGVFGLGITIGSCFIGIPIAGVPVEQRSIAITLFVCRDDSG